MPKFLEKNIEEYFISFEKIAKINECSDKYWSCSLQATLTFKGLKVFPELLQDSFKYYSALKATQLNI